MVPIFSTLTHALTCSRMATFRRKVEILFTKNFIFSFTQILNFCLRKLSRANILIGVIVNGDAIRVGVDCVTCLDFAICACAVEDSQSNIAAWWDDSVRGKRPVVIFCTADTTHSDCGLGGRFSHLLAENSRLALTNCHSHCLRMHGVLGARVRERLRRRHCRDHVGIDGNQNAIFERTHCCFTITISSERLPFCAPR